MFFYGFMVQFWLPRCMLWTSAPWRSKGDGICDGICERIGGLYLYKKITYLHIYLEIYYILSMQIIYPDILF